jgi:hypothetical protein
MRREEKPKIYFPHARRSPEKTWSEMHRKERYVTSHRIIGGRRREASWRKLGIPNLGNSARLISASQPNTGWIVRSCSSDAVRIFNFGCIEPKSKELAVVGALERRVLGPLRSSFEPRMRLAPL